MSLTAEQMEKMKAAKSAEELLAISQANGIELTAEQAEKDFEAVGKQFELSDEELGGVSGGKFYYIEYVDSPDKVSFIHQVGDYAEVATGWFSTTVACRITDIRTAGYHVAKKNFLGLPPMGKSYRDEYYCKPLEEHWYFSEGWYPRSDIEM